MTSNPLNIVVSGMIAADPYQGGATWAVLQYVLGLREMGHRVCFVEPLPAGSIRPAEIADPGTSVNVRYFKHVVETFRLNGVAALILPGQDRRSVGMSYEHIQSVCVQADVLLNVSGMLADPELIAAIPLRVYLDLDPAFVQIWDRQGIDMRFDAHTHFVTVGLALGSDECAVPLCGREWITSVQPVVLNYWPPGDSIQCDALTTVGNWRGYGSVELNGELLGQKAHSLRDLMRMPLLTEERFVLAMAIHHEEERDLRALSECGWRLLDPRRVAGHPEHYGSFIRHSKGEFGVAKSGYVKSRCGWFSDRSVCYLASGRPVLAQDTGFTRYLPTGRGLFAFRGENDVLQAIGCVNDDYAGHSRDARGLAESLFASEKVLSRLLHEVGAIA